MGWREILASLTTNPAMRFSESGTHGRIAPGMAADLVILRQDPATDPSALADVRVTVKGGEVVYSVR